MNTSKSVVWEMAQSKDAPMLKYNINKKTIRKRGELENAVIYPEPQPARLQKKFGKSWQPTWNAGKN